MATAIDALLAVILSMLFFLGLSASAICCIFSRSKSPCEGCNYYLKNDNKCLFNPIYGEPVPKQCQRESWDI